MVAWHRETINDFWQCVYSQKSNATNFWDGLACFTITWERPRLSTEAIFGCYPVTTLPAGFLACCPHCSPSEPFSFQNAKLRRLQGAALSARISERMYKKYFWIFCKTPLWPFRRIEKSRIVIFQHSFIKWNFFPMREIPPM